MKEYIVRGIKYLLENNILGKVIKIRYQGKGVSLNKFYKQGHWSTRSQLKNEYCEKFDKLFETSKDLEWVESFYLVIFYNSRHDVDNVVGMGKVFVDAFKRTLDAEGNIVRPGYVMEDDKKHYKGLCIIPDKSLPYNTFDFIILEPKW
jgi:hypothetical protein